jgi:hypothetical protein
MRRMWCRSRVLGTDDIRLSLSSKLGMTNNGEAYSEASNKTLGPVLEAARDDKME